MREQKINLEEVKEAIRNSSKNTAIYVGCDSRVFNKTSRGAKALYVTVVVLHYDGNKGARIFKDVQIHDDYNQLRVRLMNEVYITSQIAYEILDAIGDRPFEIHLDLNPSPHHKSNIVVKEASGYIMGMFGFKPKLKPDAFTASAVADHFT